MVIYENGYFQGANNALITNDEFLEVWKQDSIKVSNKWN